MRKYESFWGRPSPVLIYRNNREYVEQFDNNSIKPPARANDSVATGNLD